MGKVLVPERIPKTGTRAGRPRTPLDISLAEAQEAARKDLAAALKGSASRALRVLDEIAHDIEAPPAARVAAALGILKVAGAMREEQVQQHQGEVIIKVIRE